MTISMATVEGSMSEAMSKGVEDGDEIVCLEFKGEAEEDAEEGIAVQPRVYRTPRDIREALENEKDSEDIVVVSFKCKAANLVDSDVQKVAVAQAIYVAALVPTWEEIMTDRLPQT